MNNRGKEILDEFLKEDSEYSLRYSFNGDIVRDKDLFKDYLRELEQRIDKAKAKLQNMFDNGDDNKILDDLLELDKILGSDKE